MELEKPSLDTLTRMCPTGVTPPGAKTVPWTEKPAKAGPAPAALVLVDGPACGRQSSHGCFRFNSDGRQPAGMVLVFGCVGGVLGAMVGPGVAATAGVALGPGVGSVGEA